jgi:hypothetical protein
VLPRMNRCLAERILPTQLYLRSGRMYLNGMHPWWRPACWPWCVPEFYLLAYDLNMDRCAHTHTCRICRCSDCHDQRSRKIVYQLAIYRKFGWSQHLLSRLGSTEDSYVLCLCHTVSVIFPLLHADANRISRGHNFEKICLDDISWKLIQIVGCGLIRFEKLISCFFVWQGPKGESPSIS